MCGTLKKRVSISHNRKKFSSCIYQIYLRNSQPYGKQEKNSSKALSQVYKSISYSSISSSIYLK